MQVDAALLLLSNITSNVSFIIYNSRMLLIIILTSHASIQDFVNTSVIPQDVWELQFFKRPNSV